MACFFTLHRHPQFFSISPCKYSSPLSTCNSHSPHQYFLSPFLKRALNSGSSGLPVVSPLHESSSAKRLPETPTKPGRSRRFRPGFSSSNLDSKRVHTDLVETLGSVIINEKGVHGKTRTCSDSTIRRKNESGVSSDRTKDGNSAEEGSRKLEAKSVKGGQRNQKWKRDNKSKANPTNTKLRVQFEMCSKSGDVMGAISLYDSAIKDGVKLGQYHYTMVLYLCSSAALGVVHPAKSGSGNRSIEMLIPSDKDSILYCDNGMDSEEYRSAEEDDGCDELDVKEQINKHKRAEIVVSEEVKKYALERGFQVYERMFSESIPMTEAALTSVARMAVAMGDGDKAFDMVKQMKAMGITPKLRSYGPALSLFCSKGQADKAFEVEEHMLENGVQPEEPELEALLRVCIDVNKPDKIYYLLHKLRTAVRSVSPSSANLIQKWFESKESSVVGKSQWDPKTVVEMMENVGGGWHGRGWLGSGNWSVSQTIVRGDGSCQCCGEKLALIDLDPEETEKFAESVAAIALKREKNSSFQKFQRWLDYYGPFEAVVDAANVGLFSQKKFQLSKVKAVVNGIRQMLISRKWPLVILHNRRITGPRMDEPTNRAIIERWKNADALYATPTGSNDDWFWLYAAIKYKCLIVTNDEMRDHIFQLLGNDFFPRWKERHQVRFSFSEVGPVFHMPPPCSVVIQESERGHWHIPIASKNQSEEERTWLCIRRANQNHLSSMREGKFPEAKEARKTSRNNKSTTPKLVVLSYESILAEIQSAEKHGSVIDFQI